MKKRIGYLLFITLTAHAGFVSQLNTSFLTTADMDGDGRSDMVLVDGSNGVVRIGYQLTLRTFTWSAPRSLGIEGITDITCGAVLTNAHDVLLATSPLLNRYSVFALPSPTQSPVAQSFYGEGTGPNALAAIDIGGAGNTPHADLVSVSIMNGASPVKLNMIRSDGITFSPIASYSLTSQMHHINEVEYASGRKALGVISPLAGSSLRLYDLTSGVINQRAAISLSMSEPSYLSFFPTSSNYAQFLIWEKGSSVLKASVILESTPGSFSFSPLVSYNMGAAISSVHILQGDAEPRLIISFENGTTAGVYSYDGSAAPAPIQTITPPSGNQFVGFLPVGDGDSIVALSSPSGSLSDAVSADSYNFSGGEFVSTGSESLAASTGNKGRANVMTFINEPFVNNTPHRLQLLHAGDWVDVAGIKEGTIVAVIETDQGIDQGLGNEQDVILGDAAPLASYALANQLHSAISVFSFDSARGEEVVSFELNPSPGVYGTTIYVVISSTPSASLRYRTSPTSNWKIYAEPIPMFKDTTLEYYAVNGSKRSIIRTAQYRFSQSPALLDSDGDGIPDYVEIENGLHPIESGLDGDGDGYSDLDELLEGSNPTSAASVPANSNRVERASVYDLGVSPFAVNGGVGDDLKRCVTNVQMRLYSASGGIRGFASTKSWILSVPISDPAALFQAVPISPEVPMVVALTPTRFDLEGAGASNQLGVEMAGIYLQPTTSVTKVPYQYQGGSLATESAAWIASAKTLYQNQLRVEQGEELSFTNVAMAVLTERKLGDLLLSRGVITNGWISIFKGRSADQTMQGFHLSDLEALEHAGPSNEPAYQLRELVSSIQTSSATMPDFLSLAKDVYEVCSTFGGVTNQLGKYPLPIDVLRDFVYTGSLQSNYLAKITPSAITLSNAFSQAQVVMNQISPRSTISLILDVRTNSFTQTCPVLYASNGDAYTLYRSNKTPYRFPSSFTLQPGSQVQVVAYSDITWPACSGTDSLEIISMNLIAIPTASGADANSNFIPDAFESRFLIGSGGLATSDLDGDGYGDLQEYLDRTDPNDPSDHSGSAPVDLSLPNVYIENGNLVIGWPAMYANDFVFTVEFANHLVPATFGNEEELPKGILTFPLNFDDQKRFYRVKMRLR